MNYQVGPISWRLRLVQQIEHLIQESASQGEKRELKLNLVNNVTENNRGIIDPLDQIESAIQQGIDPQSKPGSQLYTESYLPMPFNVNVHYNPDNLIQVQDESNPITYNGQFLQQYIQTQGNNLFTDKDFPPEYKSLVSNPATYELSQVFKKYQWKRPSEFYPNGYALWNNIAPTDVVQGALGNCYFLAAISALAEISARIQRIFVNKEVNKQGVYVLRICECGEFREIALDDLLPVKGKKNAPAFTHNKDQEIWVMLLEKAWAKINESYEQIEGGTPSEVLHDFTGAPVESYHSSEVNAEDMWNTISNANRQNYVMCCGQVGYKNTAEQNTKEGKTSKGLVTSHAYSLIDTYELADGRRLCKVRNPWGYFEWNGAWSDDDPNWTEELAQQVGFNKDKDGVFFMSYEDFRDNFGRVDVCYIHDDYKYTSFKVNQKTNQGILYKMTINTPGQYFISLNQPNIREWDSAKQQNISPYLLMIIAQKQDNKYIQFANKFGSKKEIWAQVTLEPGEYHIYTNVIYNVEREESSISISSYGVDNVNFSVDTNIEYILPQFFNQIYCEIGKNNPKKKFYKQNNECYRVFGLEGIVAYIYFNNFSKLTLQNYLNFKDTAGVSVFIPPIYPGLNKISIGPNYEMCYVFIINPFSNSLSYPGEKFSFKS